MTQDVRELSCLEGLLPVLCFSHYALSLLFPSSTLQVLRVGTAQKAARTTVCMMHISMQR